MVGIAKGSDAGLLKAVALREGVSHSVLIAAAKWLSWSGNTAQRSLMVIAASAWLLWKRKASAGVVMLVMPTLAAVTATILKESFDRARPNLVPHLENITNPAFPSGHAMNAAAFFILVALLIPGRQPRLTMAACISIIFLIGVSRIMLGVHWPSDVVAGWILGTAFALTGWAITIRVEGK